MQVIGCGSRRRDESGVSEKMQDEREVMSETSGNATRETGEDGWRLEPEGETETLETKVFWNRVEGATGYLMVKVTIGGSK